METALGAFRTSRRPGIERHQRSARGRISGKISGDGLRRHRHEEKHLLPGVIVWQRRVPKPTVFYQRPRSCRNGVRHAATALNPGRSSNRRATVQRDDNNSTEVGTSSSRTRFALLLSHPPIIARPRHGSPFELALPRARCRV
jgi:hypothetical protein